ncbi:MAG: HDIG domain-containing protein [Chthonomonadales bacterium]|nr:HDIG domain-containing protein [Chthonomonadales bacterium]
MSHGREGAWALLTEYTESESLRKHALAVEAAMRHYAARFGEDAELWGNTGLLHDFDYERWPTAPEHPTNGLRILEERGWPAEMREALAGHAEYLGVPRATRMAKALFAVDELCGFLTAVAYVKPSRSIADVETASVRKKMKDRAFARAVSRDDIVRGAEELGVPLDEHISACIQAMRGAAGALGL